MALGVKPTQDVKDVFMKCGTCSQTFAHLLNREFGNADEEVEVALDPLAGGIANHGHQCGMLWGAAMAIGAEASRKFPDQDEAVAVAVTATQLVVQSFLERSRTVNCREITGYNLNNVFGLVAYMLKAMSKGIRNSQCFNLAEDWAPEAIEASTDGLQNESIQLTLQPMSCASEVVKRMGGEDKEVMLVAGFAGGLGLSGKACGALSAAIWYRTLLWCKDHSGKRPPMFNNPIAKKLIRAFKKETGSCMDCNNITGCQFLTIDDHSKYLKDGGCNKLLNILANTNI